MENKTVCDILSTVESQVLAPLQSFLLALAVLLFIWGIIEFIAGASSEEARTTGKKHMIWGIVGMVIILASMAIIVVLENFFGGRGIPLFC